MLGLHFSGAFGEGVAGDSTRQNPRRESSVPEALSILGSGHTGGGKKMPPPFCN
jgi:hypothetical protein